MVGGPGLGSSLVGLLVSLGLVLVANWQFRLPYERRVRLVPWLAVQFIALAVAVILLAHLVSLGLGHDFPGRRSGY